MQRYLDDKWLALMVLNIITMIAIFIKGHSVKPQPIDLSDINLKLTSISQKLDVPSTQADLTPINQNLDQLKKLIHQLQSKDDHQLGNLFSTGQEEITKQLNQISFLLGKIEDQKHPIKRLPISALPFKVLSIDSIQEVSVVSIAYDYKTIGLEQGDSLAGWTIVQLNFSKQYIEFENSDKVHVVMHLKAKDSNHV